MKQIISSEKMQTKWQVHGKLNSFNGAQEMRDKEEVKQEANTTGDEFVDFNYFQFKVMFVFACVVSCIPRKCEVSDAIDMIASSCILNVLRDSL